MGMVGLRDVLVVAPAASFHPPHHHESLLPSAEHPIIPLLTAAPYLVDDAAHAHDSHRSKPPSGIHLWQAQPPPPTQQQQQHHHHHHNLPPQNPNPNPNLSYLKKTVPMLDATGFLAGGGTSTCQDCGNQAKKDCIHRRCRTCCKSRGFDCSTHVKSTWVPASRRRERQLSATAATAAAAGSSASTSAPKKPRLISSQTTTTTASHTSTSNTTPRSFDTSSSQQDASFRDGLPGHVRAPAVFKCVRVTSIDDGDDQYAYQAMVRIGGHVFKGFLYDQGADDVEGRLTDRALVATSDSNNNNIPNLSELHLGGAGRNNGPPSSSAMLTGASPSDLYAAGGACLLGGTNYRNPIN